MAEERKQNFRYNLAHSKMTIISCVSKEVDPVSV